MQKRLESTEEGSGKFNFLGTTFDVVMKDNASEVDSDGRKACFGQIDSWDCSIRLYRQRKIVEIRKTLVHELIHLICDWIRTDTLNPTETDVDQIAELLYDTLARNNLWNNEAWKKIIPAENDNDKSNRQLQQDEPSSG